MPRGNFRRDKPLVRLDWRLPFKRRLSSIQCLQEDLAKVTGQKRGEQLVVAREDRTAMSWL